MRKFKIIRVSGVATGVGFIIKIGKAVQYSETVCNTLFDTGDDEKDARESEKWAKIICKALNTKEKTTA